MMVRQAISDGFAVSRSSAIACAIASGSCPSMLRTAQPEMAGERDCFLAEALHQAAIAGEHIGEVIDEAVAMPGIGHALGKRHADRGRNPLPQWTRRGLDTWRVTILGMARRLRAPFPEGLD